MTTLLARTAVSGDVDHLVDSLLENMEYFIQLLVYALLTVPSDNNDTVDGSLLELGDPLGIEGLAITSRAGITEGLRIGQHTGCEAVILGFGCIDSELITAMVCQLAEVSRLRAGGQYGTRLRLGALEESPFGDLSRKRRCLRKQETENLIVSSYGLRSSPSRRQRTCLTRSGGQLCEDGHGMQRHSCLSRRKRMPRPSWGVQIFERQD